MVAPDGLGNSQGRRLSLLDLDLLSTTESQNQVFSALLSCRNGSVLSRSTILKSEHFGDYRQAEIDINLLGAPNFRRASLNIFGVAQPTVPGLTAILRLLRSAPTVDDDLVNSDQTCCWFSTREEPIIYVNGKPFVLRDAESPFENIRSYAGITSQRLELMEQRLKADVLREAAQNNGLVLVHDEIGDRKIVPCLSSVDEVLTSAEVFGELQQAGFRVEYHRVPVSSEQAPTDAFIDEYVKIFESMPAKNHSVVFSCGIGVGRTTFAMVLGMILRRSLILDSEGTDPFDLTGSPNIGGINEEKTTRTVLCLIAALEQGLHGTRDGQSAVQWIMARSDFLDNLKAAISGNYQVIVDLVRALDQGPYWKSIVDKAIDECETLLNIREQILISRVKHFIDDSTNALDIGVGYLERYFSLIAFCAFLHDRCLSREQSMICMSFAQWMQQNRDVWNNLNNFRKDMGKLRFFRPIDDLSVLSSRQHGLKFELVAPAAVAAGTTESQLPEYQVIKSRSGFLVPHTILKIDHWGEPKIRPLISGAPNFYRIEGTKVYAGAQPTLLALKSIVGVISESLGPGEELIWINVREEPIIYIGNEPYVLRDRYATLRNTRSFSGISKPRLEDMENRLKDDVLAEASLHNCRVLVHSESKTSGSLSVLDCPGSY